MPEGHRANHNKAWTILLYYKYVTIEKPEEFTQQHLDFCKSLGLKGRILISKLGINGTVGGPKEATDAYIETMRQDPRFADMEFKTSEGSDKTFKKIFVRHRKELVTMQYDEPLNPNKEGGTYLEPEQLKELYDHNDDFVIIDMRNEYEAAIGRFENAVVLPIENWKELPEVVDQQLMKYKDKKVVTYCTGGIRCETGTALLKKKGFKNVYQLHGGIHEYVKKFPKDHWMGELYVFDERVSVKVNDKVLGECFHCHQPCSFYINCTNVECNKMMIMCPSCRDQWHDGCSIECSKKPRPKELARDR